MSNYNFVSMLLLFRLCSCIQKLVWTSWFFFLPLIHVLLFIKFINFFEILVWPKRALFNDKSNVRKKLFLNATFYLKFLSFSRFICQKDNKIVEGEYLFIWKIFLLLFYVEYLISSFIFCFLFESFFLSIENWISNIKNS